MDRLKDFPIEKSGYSLRTERAHLNQLVLSALIAEPRLSRKPADRAQHEYAGVTSRDEPPIHYRALDDLPRAAQLPVLADDTTEQRTHFPGEREAVPAVTSPDLFKIGVEARRCAARNRRSDANGVDAVSQSVLPVQEIVIEFERLVVERRHESVAEAHRLDVERSVGPS